MVECEMQMKLYSPVCKNNDKPVMSAFWSDNDSQHIIWQAFIDLKSSRVYSMAEILFAKTCFF